MRNPHVIWASVSIIFMMLAGVVTLASLDKDVTVILTLAGLIAIPVLSAFGVAIYQKMDQVKDLSNGGNRQLLDMIKELQDTVKGLALAVPPAASQSEDNWEK